MKHILLLLVVLSAGTADVAHAQNWEFDARAVALGGATGPDSLALGMVAAPERDYHAIVLPIGLIQAARDWDRLNPANDSFDMVRAVEYAASPFHYVIGRDTNSPVSQFATDIRHGSLSRDLNAYRPVTLPNELDMGGQSVARWSATIPVFRGHGAAHGIYVGAGPYFSMRNVLAVDRQLTDILASETPLYIANARMPLVSTTQGQTAIAFTGGYRGKVASLAGSDRSGVYVAGNYNYLRGVRYEDVDLRLQLATDNAGLLTIGTPGSSPLLVDRNHASSGNGMAVDLGVAVVVNRWAAGFSAFGIGNHIDWSDVERTSYSLGSLFSTVAQFFQSQATPVGDVRVVVPVDYRWSLGYEGDRWAAVGDIGRGFNGTSFHGGLERRLGVFEVRGGSAYSRERWTPAAGVGVDLSAHVGLDAAIYGSTANVERERRPAIALSLRVHR